MPEGFCGQQSATDLLPPFVFFVSFVVKMYYDCSGHKELDDGLRRALISFFAPLRLGFFS